MHVHRAIPAIAGIAEMSFSSTKTDADAGLENVRVCPEYMFLSLNNAACLSTVS